MSTIARPAPASGRGASLALWAPLGVVIAVALGVAASEAPLPALGSLAIPAVVALFVRPRWLPAVLLITIFAEGLELGGLTVSRVAGPFVLLIVIVRTITGETPRFPSRRLLAAVGAYATFAFASILWTVNPETGFSESGTGSAIASLALSLAYLAAFATLIEDKQDLKRLGVAVWAVAVPLGLIAIGQYLGGAERAVGGTGDANYFASRQVVAVPICVLVAAHARGGWRIIAYLGMAVVVGSVMTSLSRGGLLALFAVFVLLLAQPARLLFASRAQKGLAIAFTVIGASVLLYAAYDDLAARSQSLFTTQEGGSGRENLWRAAMTGWKQNEAGGLGYGAFPSQSNDLLQDTPGVDFSAYELRETGQVPHSMYLGTLVELGVVGLVLLLLLLWSLFTTIRSASRNALARGDLLVAGAARTLIVSLLGFLLASFFLSSETDRMFWVIMGAALALSRLAAGPHEGPAGRLVASTAGRPPL